MKGTRNMPNDTAFRGVKGDLWVFLAMAMFGCYPLFLRFLPHIHVLTFLFFFQAVGAISFGILLVKQHHLPIPRRERLLLLALAVVAVANDLSLFLAYRLTTVANAAVAHQMVSVFLLLFAPLFLRERTRRNEWIALIFSLAGIIVLYSGKQVGGGAHHLAGITLGLASAVFYALLIVLYRHLPQRGLTITKINFWRYLTSTFLILPFAWSTGGLGLHQADIVPLVGFGLLFAVIASGIHNYGISKTRSLHVSVIGKSEPVIAALYAFLFLKETPSPEAIAGGILIIGSSIWLAMRKEVSLPA